MSLETWKEEYYPVDAVRCKKKDALEHSLQKWIGLRKTNLKKHKMHESNGDIRSENPIDNEYFVVSGSTCALCHVYLNNLDSISPCKKCPLSIARNDIACDRVSRNRKSTYHRFVNDANPEPMIRLIRKAIKNQKKKP